MDVATTHDSQIKTAPVDYQTEPAKYKHWRVAYEGPVATLTMDVNEDGGLRPGYKLKLNSYDLGVDIELHDVLQRIRFEHPEIRCVMLTSAKNRVFCSGANIYMLGLSSHAWKVNFCKFTNETRNGIEDSSAHSGLKFLAALNGTTAGGGYELALACDEIILVDDRSSAVSLPEVPLLGVLPGTGGLTRVTDKRKVRRDHVDIFCTTADGVKGQRAKDWGLVDDVVKTQQFAEHVKQRALDLANRSDRPANAQGVALTPLQRTIDDAGRHYEFVDAQVNREARTVTLTVRAPEFVVALTLESALAAGARWWPLQMARELDDAILGLRTSEAELGLWIMETAGNPDAVLAFDNFILNNQGNWFRARGFGHDAAHVCAAGCFLAFDLRAGEAEFVFCGNFAGAGARGGPRLHARHAGGRGAGGDVAIGNEFRGAADGESSFACGGALLSGANANRSTAKTDRARAASEGRRRIGTGDRRARRSRLAG